MPININEATNEFTKEVQNIYRSDLCKVILYGSYARGDYQESSDIDILILVNLTNDEIKKTADDISDIAFELLMKHGVDISPIIINQMHFNYWADTLPFYRNINKEGVVLRG